MGFSRGVVMRNQYRLLSSLGLTVILMVLSGLGQTAAEIVSSKKSDAKSAGTNKSQQTKKGQPSASKKVTAKSSGKAKSIRSTVVIYQEVEKGIEPYVSRYIINKSFMRIDDGKPNTGYVLLDRKKDVIYSVSIENESILLIEKKEMKVKKPTNLAIEVLIHKHPSKLKLEGKQGHEFEVRVGGKNCRNNIVVNGVLPEFVTALKQYRSILANQHIQNLFKTPVNMRNKCFMAYHIYQHELHTSRGLIVRSWNNKGKQSMLRDYKRNQKALEILFKLPKKYSRFKAGQVP